MAKTSSGVSIPIAPGMPPLVLPPQFFWGGGVLLALMILSSLSRKAHRNDKKPKLGRARQAKKSEWQKSQARVRLAIINSHLTNNFKKFGGWIGRPKTILSFARFFGITDADIFLDRLNEHLLCLGGSGAGKSFSVFDPLVRSLIDQGFSLGCFDFKGDEEGDDECCPSSALAGYAIKRGYTIRVVAPGYPDSDRINLLDFVTDPTSALQLADILYANINKGKKQSDDGFFPPAGKLLLQFIFLVAKHQPIEGVADLALCHKILALPDLIARVTAKDLPQQIKMVADQFISTAGSPETAASIAATALSVLTKFQVDPAWATFCGKSTMPILAGEKELIIYRLNPTYEEVISPLLASVMHLQARANAYGKRPTKKPFCMLIDEFPRIYLPTLSADMAVVRSKRFAYILAAQSYAAIEETYGPLGLRAILSNAKTQFIGQQNDDETLDKISKASGKEDIKYLTFGDSRNKGAVLGGNASENANLTTRDVVPIEMLKELPQGTFYVRSPGTEGKVNGEKRAQMLYRLDIKPREEEIQDAEVCKADWFKFRNARILNPIAVPLSDRQLSARGKYADEYLPMPKVNKSAAFAALVKK